MYALDFEYAGEKLSDYGMMICRFDGAGGVETVSSGSDLTFGQVKSAAGNRFGLSNTAYDSAYTATFQICKNPCEQKSGRELTLTTEEISSLQRWLCRKNQYLKFKIDQKGYEHIYWNVTFSAKQIAYRGEVIGLELTMYTDAPYAFMDEIVVEKVCEANVPFDIYDISDEPGFVYPRVEVTFLEKKEGTVFTLKNESETENRITAISQFKVGETITMDGTKQLITTSSREHVTLPGDFNYYFPRLINTYENNKNVFRANLRCKIVVTYAPVRKVGL